MANNTTTMRIDKSLYDTIKVIANTNDKEIQETLKEAITDFRRKILFQKLKKEVNELKQNKELWEEEQEEKELWDNTSGDNIE